MSDTGKVRLTDAQRDTLTACRDWAAVYEIVYHRNDATGKIIDPVGQQLILGTLLNRGLIEYGPPNNTYRITDAGRAALEGKSR